MQNVEILIRSRGGGRWYKCFVCCLRQRCKIKCIFTRNSPPFAKHLRQCDSWLSVVLFGALQSHWKTGLSFSGLSVTLQLWIEISQDQKVIDWCWLMMVGADWFSLMLFDAAWYCLTLIHADAAWCWLALVGVAAVADVDVIADAYAVTTSSNTMLYQE